MLKTFTFSLLTILSVTAQTSQPLLPFQGRVADANGKPVPDGTRLVRFEIFSEPENGNLLWAGELHRATINGGLVNVILGGKNPFPKDRVDQPDKSFFDQSLHLQVTADANLDNQITSVDPPLQPRQTLVPVIFAHESANARLLQGYDWQAMLGASSPSGKIDGGRIANLTSNSIAPQTINSNQIAPFGVSLGNLVPKPIGSDIGVNGFAVSPDSGFQKFRSVNANGINETMVTNLLVTLVTTGRPVLVGLTSAASESWIEAAIDDRDNVTQTSVRFYRNETILAGEGTLGLNTSVNFRYLRIPASSFSCVDFPPAGRHQYRVAVRVPAFAGGDPNRPYEAKVSNVRLFAMELH